MARLRREVLTDGMIGLRNHGARRPQSSHPWPGRVRTVQRPARGSGLLPTSEQLARSVEGALYGMPFGQAQPVRPDGLTTFAFRSVPGRVSC